MLDRVRDSGPKGLLLGAAALFSVFPLLSMFSAALAPEGTTPVGISLPSNPHWHNFVDAWQQANLVPLLESSTLIVIGVLPIAIIIGAMAGYGIAQLRIPLGGPLFLLFVLGLTLPFEVVVVPLYYQMQSFGLLNTRLGLIIPLIGLNMPFAVFWMRTHFQSIPLDITEASAIDGANSWKNFIHVQIPLAVPALASLGVLMFLSTWNQFLLAIVLIDDPTKRTMAGALAGFKGAHTTDVVLLNAGALTIMAPSILVFIIFQKYFVQAMLAGAVKG